MRRHQHGRIVDLLRQREELLAQGMRRLQLGTHMIIIPETTECREQLVRIVEVLTELPRTRVGLGDLRRRVAFGGNQRCPEGDQHIHFTLDALTGLRERGQQLQSLRDERDDLVGCMPLGGVLRGLLEVLHGPLVVPPALKVHRQLRRDLRRAGGHTCLRRPQSRRCPRTRRAAASRRYSTC